MNGYMEKKIAEITELNAELNEKSLRGAFCRNEPKNTSPKFFSEKIKYFRNTLLLLFVL